MHHTTLVLLWDENADGRLEVFAAGNDGALWHIWQTAPNGTWSSWASLGTPSNVQFLSGYTVGKNADGRLEVFTVGSDGALWHIWQNSPNGTWNTWTSFGTIPNVQFTTAGPAVGKNKDGRLEVLIAGNDGALWH